MFRIKYQCTWFLVKALAVVLLSTVHTALLSFLTPSCPWHVLPPLLFFKSRHHRATVQPFDCTHGAPRKAQPWASDNNFRQGIFHMNAIITTLSQHFKQIIIILYGIERTDPTATQTAITVDPEPMTSDKKLGSPRRTADPAVITPDHIFSCSKES